jgi:hypothetical protein
MPTSVLDAIPLWLFFLVAVVLVLGSLELGLRLGERRRQRAEHEQPGPVGTAVAALLGLLAFLMAFTFGLAASRFDTRRTLLLDEANAIGTCYLRAGLLPEPQRGEVQRLLREYVDVRLAVPQAAGRPEALRELVTRSEALQDALWSQVEALTRAGHGSPIDALFISALNEVIDLHAKRVVIGMQYRIPPIIWGVLAAISVVVMVGMGFQFGLAGRRSVSANLALALAFSAVILLIRDLDQPAEGWLRVSQRPLLELKQKLDASVGSPGRSSGALP